MVPPPHGRHFKLKTGGRQVVATFQDNPAALKQRYFYRFSPPRRRVSPCVREFQTLLRCWDTTGYTRESCRAQLAEFLYCRKHAKTMGLATTAHQKRALARAVYGPK